MFGVFAGLEVEVPVGLWLPSGLGLLDEVELSVVLWPREVALPVGCEPLGELELVAASGLWLLVDVELALLGAGELFAEPESLAEGELAAEFGSPVDVPPLVECEPVAESGPPVELVLPACPVPLVALGPLVGFGPAAEL